MRKELGLTGGIGIGVGLMYLLDPDRGRKRRAMMRDQADHLRHVISDGMDVASRDLSNRTRGMVSGIKEWIQQRPLNESEEVENDILEARVRSKLGRAVSHPHAIEVHANHGAVMLKGPIIKKEVNSLLSEIASVAGVKKILNGLETHDHPDAISSLQGIKHRKSPRFELMQTNWSPAARLIVILGAAGSVFYGARRRDLLGYGLMATALGFLVRALSNMELKQLIGLRPKPVQVHKTVNIHAPQQKVVQFWEKHPDFSRSLESVQRAGKVQFTTNPDGSTRMDLQLYYNPVAGIFGQLFAKLFKLDTRSRINNDLMRLKSLLEFEPAKQEEILRRARNKQHFFSIKGQHQGRYQTLGY